jgi:hypothetical protein
MVPDPPDSDQFLSTKRPPALSDTDREAKRFCKQPGQLLPGGVALELNSEPNSLEAFNIASNVELENNALQYGINFGTDWSNVVPPGIFGELDPTWDPPASRLGSFLPDSMPAQVGEMDMQSIPGPDTLYHQPATQGNTYNVDLHYSFDMNINIPSLELLHDPNIGYTGSLPESWIFPDSSCSPFTGPLIDGALANIDPENGSGCQRLEPSQVYELENTQIVSKIEGALATGFEEVKSMGNENTLMGHDEVLSGKPQETRFSHKVLTRSAWIEFHNRPQPTTPSKLTTGSFFVDPNQIDTCFGVVRVFTFRRRSRQYADQV